MTLDELLDHAAEWAAKFFDEKGEVHPMWIAITAADERLVIATPWETGKDKDIIIEKLRRFFRERDVVSYALMAESWILEGNEDEPGIKDYMEGRKPISQHPNRKEVILVTAEDKNSARMSMCYIERKPHLPPVLTPFQKFPGDHNTGRMMGLLREFNQ